MRRFFFHDLKQDIPTEVEMFKLVVVSATCSIAELNQNCVNKSNENGQETMGEIGEIDLPRLSEAFPPDNAPKGRAPVGVKPFS